MDNTHRRTFVRNGCIALAVPAVAGCLDRDDPDDSQTDDPDDSGMAEPGQLTIGADTPDSIQVRDPVEIAATVENGTGERQSGTVVLELEYVDPEVDAGTYPDHGPDGDPELGQLVIEYPDSPPSAEVIVDAGDSETVAFEIPTAYKNLELGGLSLGENEFAVRGEFEGATVSDERKCVIEDAPVEWFQPDGMKGCPVCGMDTEHYEGWHAQATHADGSRIEFCAIGCAVEYWLHPEDHELSGFDGKHEGTLETELVSLWVPDFTDVELSDHTDTHPGYEAFIDMREGYFVLDDETAYKFHTPMPGGSPPCFAAYDDAVAYVDGELANLPAGVDMSNVDEDDIVELDDLEDRDAGKLYRAGYQA
ncbi:nitrous oxide reductase accessory protein NosL [Natrarchaeobaculum aegyptiacum]|uniref:Lipoprotein n=1 Tax=Natrarchaeobaculum aegyptiacum TaxID=745377 RepID=A0A2Z2I2Y8_9EURY|nr:nitrous oxide reductase accessory protein NosL [Natrarchaeobaculum aegyptiacum]ARS91468.1 hypothetical protein B1756_18235 [Natrarchaeobaculum aegyptiacum]